MTTAEKKRLLCSSSLSANSSHHNSVISREGMRKSSGLEALDNVALDDDEIYSPAHQQVSMRKKMKLMMNMK